jgi:hypothetical protein
MAQGPWPTIKREPVGDVLIPDGYQKTDRNLTGPLRMGTARGVGPGGLVAGGTASDFGMDRVTPRGFDPAGSHNERQPRQESSPLLSRSIRSRSRGER